MALRSIAPAAAWLSLPGLIARALSTSASAPACAQVGVPASQPATCHASAAANGSAAACASHGDTILDHGCTPAPFPCTFSSPAPSCFPYSPISLTPSPARHPLLSTSCRPTPLAPSIAHATYATSSLPSLASTSPASLTTSRHMPGHEGHSRHPHSHTDPFKGPAASQSHDPAAFPVNQAVTAPTLVVLQRGAPPQRMALQDALDAAQQQECDLVQLPCVTDPPVAVIARHSKLVERHEFTIQKLLPARLNSKRGKDKDRQPFDSEVHLSTRMASNDFERRLQQMRRLLEEGNRLQVVVEGKKGSEPSELQACMAKVMERLREGNLGTAGNVATVSGKLVVLIKPVLGRLGAITPQVEAAHAVLRELAGIAEQ